MNAITQSTLAKPDTSWRRKRSPDTTMSSQNHNMNMNIVKASAIKLLNVNPPSNGIGFIPCPSRVGVIVEQCQRRAQRLLARVVRRLGDGRDLQRECELSRFQPTCGMS